MILKKLPTVALAENDTHDANLLLIALQQAAPNLNVDLLRSGEEVIQYFFGSGGRQEKNSHAIACDLLLLNLALPKLDGFKVLRQLQWLYRDDLTLLPPIVVLCESDDPEIIANLSLWSQRFSEQSRAGSSISNRNRTSLALLARGHPSATAREKAGQIRFA